MKPAAPFLTAFIVMALTACSSSQDQVRQYADQKAQQLGESLRSQVTYSLTADGSDCGTAVFVLKPASEKWPYPVEAKYRICCDHKTSKCDERLAPK